MVHVSKIRYAGQSMVFILVQHMHSHLLVTHFLGHRQIIAASYSNLFYHMQRKHLELYLPLGRKKTCNGFQVLEQTSWTCTGVPFGDCLILDEQWMRGYCVVTGIGYYRKMMPQNLIMRCGYRIRSYREFIAFYSNL